MHRLDELEAQQGWAAATTSRQRELMASDAGDSGRNAAGTRRDAATKEALVDDSRRPRAVATAPTQFIQICASQNDLFALDKEGNIYQYNFNAKAWVKLGAGRSYDEHA